MIAQLAALGAKNYDANACWQRPFLRLLAEDQENRSLAFLSSAFLNTVANADSHTKSNRDPERYTDADRDPKRYPHCDARPQRPARLQRQSRCSTFRPGHMRESARVLIGGFIVARAVEKRLIVRALGPSLGAAGVSGALADPSLQLVDSTGHVLGANDNWMERRSDARHHRHAACAQRSARIGFNRQPRPRCLYRDRQRSRWDTKYRLGGSL